MATTEKTRVRKTNVAKAAQDVIRNASSTDHALESFARSLGQKQKKSLDESLALHKAYVKLGDGTDKESEAQKAFRTKFLVAYLVGHMGVSVDIARTIEDAPRFGAKDRVKDGKTIKARSQAQQRAYDCARKDFGFHIARKDKRIGQHSVSRVRILPQVREELAKVCDKVFEEGFSKDALLRIAEQARALAAKMK